MASSASYVSSSKNGLSVAGVCSRSHGHPRGDRSVAITPTSRANAAPARRLRRDVVDICDRTDFDDLFALFGFPDLVDLLDPLRRDRGVAIDVHASIRAACAWSFSEPAPLMACR